MNPRHFVLAPLLLPAVRPSDAEAGPSAQRYDAGYQLYQEDGERMRIESYYLRAGIDIDEETAIRIQDLRDTISGSSPTGVLPDNPTQSFLTPFEDVRTAVLGALGRQFGDHRVELELSHSQESDYESRGVSLSDAWDLNHKNTTVAFGFNGLFDLVDRFGIPPQDKTGLDFFTGVTQVIDKNTIVTVNFTLGYNYGYLNDPYKVGQRDVSADYGLPPNTIVDTYAENRPDHRLREVLLLEGTHFFEPVNAALNLSYRLSNDDYGVFSQCLGVEWRQGIGAKFQITPYFRYYVQNAADFFMNTFDGVNIKLDPDTGQPTDYPDGSSPNYSADYRLSALDSMSLGIRLGYEFNDHVSANVSYERYEMNGRGGDHSPDAAYPTADMLSCCISAKF